MTPDFFNTIPTNEQLAVRFSFIDNEILRENIVIYFRYIIFLLNLSAEPEIDSLKYTLYKDLIVYTASIVESLLQYTIERQVLLGRVDKTVMGYNKKSIQIGKIDHDCDNLQNAVIEIVRTEKRVRLGSGDRIDFKDINTAAKRARILDGALFEAAEGLRRKRNTIHLSTLTKSSDDYFSKTDVGEVFNNAHDIILAVEKLFKV